MVIETPALLSCAAKYRDAVQYPLRRVLHANGVHYRFATFNPKSYTTCMATTTMNAVDSDNVDVENLVNAIHGECAKQRLFLKQATVEALHYVRIDVSNPASMIRTDVLVKFMQGSLHSVSITSQPVEITKC